MKKDLKSLKQAMKDNKPDQEIRKMKQEILKAMRMQKQNQENGLKQKEKRSQLHAQEAIKILTNVPRSYRKTGFSREVVNEYFQTAYEDKKRDCQYNPLWGILKPAAPKKQLSENPPSLAELQEVVLRKINKLNKSSPGTKCYSLCDLQEVLSVMHGILRKIWKKGKISFSWRIGEVVLIPNEDDKSRPEPFRNITLTNVRGKKFFQVLATRLLSYLVQNDYIDKAIQKGFITGIAGCVEHTQALMETLLDAKENERETLAAWLNLTNAYVSVAHNLVQFALE